MHLVEKNQNNLHNRAGIRKAKRLCGKLMLAGMDVARLNFSHGTYDEHKVKIDRIKKLREELGLHTALMLDTKGPEIRLGKIKNGSATVYAGQKFTIYCDEREGDATGASVTYPGLYRDAAALAEPYLSTTG